MKLVRTLTPHDCETGEALKEVAATDIVEYPDDHPAVVYLNADKSVLWLEVMIEDGTLVKYEPLEDL